MHKLPIIPQKQRNARRSPTAGNRGNGGKWIRKAKRHRIYARDKYRCVWCTAELGAGVPTLDHVLPRSHGGTNESHNLITACGGCNSERGELTPLQFATRLAHRIGNQSVAKVGYVERVLARVIAAIEAPLPRAE